MKWLPCFKVHGLPLLNSTQSCLMPAVLSTHPAQMRAACASWGTKRWEKVASAPWAGAFPEMSEDAHMHRLITKGDVCSVDLLCRAPLNTTALVAMRPGRQPALVLHLLSYKCGRNPHSSWASKEKSNFLNAFC